MCFHNQRNVCTSLKLDRGWIQPHKSSDIWMWRHLYRSTLAVREITKSSSTFSATNINSNIKWLLQPYDTIRMKSDYRRINYYHDNIARRSHIMICNSVSKYFGTKFSSIYLAKGEKWLGFRLSFVNLQRAKDGTHVFDAKCRYVERLVSHLINYFSKWLFTLQQENYTTFAAKNEILYFSISLSDFLWLFYSGFMHNFICFELYHAVEAIL